MLERINHLQPADAETLLRKWQDRWQAAFVRYGDTAHGGRVWEHSEGERKALFYRWGEVDAPAAVAWLFSDHRPPSATPWREDYESVFAAWSANDLSGVRDWLAAHTQNPNYGPALRGFLAVYAAVDIDQATELAVACRDDGDFAHTLALLPGPAMQQKSTADFRKWFLELPTNDMRRILFNQIVSLLLQRSLPDTLAWTKSQAASPWRCNSAIRGLAVKYAQKDPRAAVAWVSALPPVSAAGLPRQVGLNEIVAYWRTSDPAELQRWLKENAGTPTGSQAANFLRAR